MLWRKKVLNENNITEKHIYQAWFRGVRLDTLSYNGIGVDKLWFTIPSNDDVAQRSICWNFNVTSQHERALDVAHAPEMGRTDRQKGKHASLLLNTAFGGHSYYIVNE